MEDCTWIKSISEEELEKITPFHRLRPESINPFGTYLNLDCTDDIDGRIERWERDLRIAIVVNNMSFEDSKKFVEMTLLSNVYRWYINVDKPRKDAMLAGDDIGKIISQITHEIRIEFIGEGYYERHSTEYARKYLDAIHRLTLLDMPDIDSDWSHQDYLLKKTRKQNIYDVCCKEKSLITIIGEPKRDLSHRRCKHKKLF